MNNFNFVAPFYDLLAKLVFGKSIEKATTAHIEKIRGDQTVLILGGGTGKLLEELPRTGSIHFLDSSQKMVSRAKGRTSEAEVKFEVADFLAAKLEGKYDVVICPFFLDCFGIDNLDLVLVKIKEVLAEDGVLLVTDFQGNERSVLMRAMHFFFRLFAGLESKKLLNIHQHILQNNFSVQSEEFFHKNMIFSRVYGNL